MTSKPRLSGADCSTIRLSPCLIASLPRTVVMPEMIPRSTVTLEKDWW